VERTAILVLGHGSRRVRANLEFELLVSRFRARRPELEVGHAYVELAPPLFEEGLAQLARRADRVIVLPLFLFAAGHVKGDIPRALTAAQAAFPGVRFEAARELGVDRTMVEVALGHARFIAITHPRFAAAAERAALSRPKRMVVLPYFLFEGLLVEQLAEEVRAFSEGHPEIDVRLAPHLGVQEGLLELLDARLSEVLDGRTPLPSDASPPAGARFAK
jgi:sirohydrochlorin cobaltochelatase